MEIVKIFPYCAIEGEFPERRKTIIQRPDSLYTIGDEYFYRSLDNDGSVIAEGWAQSQPSGNIFDTIELAEQEIFNTIDQQT